ncbi:MAG: hypothetical protein JJT94_05355 [Bernardetiaceae bacterium]|nr:hypothetical protein [Bernardetiaceae bacterium]
MKKIFENKHTEIYDIRDEVPHTVFAYWKGYLIHSNPEAIEACEQSLDYFKKENIKVMISDHVYLEGAAVPFLEWLHDYYFPKAVENGLKAEIVLDSEHAIGKISLDLMYDEQDLHKKIKKGELFTPKAENLDIAKKMAQKIIADSMMA